MAIIAFQADGRSDLTPRPHGDEHLGRGGDLRRGGGVAAGTG